MDIDDVMFPNKLEILSSNLLSKGTGHIATGLVEYFSEYKLGDGYMSYQNWLNELTYNGSNYNDIYKECVIPSPCWMVYKFDFEVCGGFNSTTYPEDYDLCFRFYKNSLTVIPCNKFIHRWRDYDNRTSRTDDHYSDNRFLDLKCDYFLTIDYDHKKNIVLWGAGKKGKKIAQFLNRKQINFKWGTNNSNKIDHSIYGITLEDINKLSIDENSQLIIAVANKEEQSKIKTQLKGHSCAYFFC